MINTEIVSLFSTPIYISNTKIKFTKKELAFVKKSKKDSVVNIGNVNSKDSYVLEKKEFWIKQQWGKLQEMNKLNDNINLKILIDECAIVIPLMFSSGVADGKLFSEMFKKMNVGMYEYLSKNTLIHPIFLNYLK